MTQKHCNSEKKERKEKKRRKKKNEKIKRKFIKIAIGILHISYRYIICMHHIHIIYIYHIHISCIILHILFYSQ